MPAVPRLALGKYPPTCRRTTFGMTVSLQAGRRGERRADLPDRRGV